MNNFYEFAGQHPFLAFLLAYMTYLVIVAPLRLANRFIRSRNIKHAGWPPSHLDADGDAVVKQ